MTEQERKLLEDARIFLELGAHYAPDDRLGVMFKPGYRAGSAEIVEEFQSKGLATVMREVAAKIRKVEKENE